MAAPGMGLEQGLEVILKARESAGRSHLPFGIEGQLSSGGDLDASLRLLDQWKAAGTTHLSINTMYTGCKNVDDHIQGLRVMADALELS